MRHPVGSNQRACELAPPCLELATCIGGQIMKLLQSRGGIGLQALDRLLRGLQRLRRGVGAVRRALSERVQRRIRIGSKPLYFGESMQGARGQLIQRQLRHFRSQLFEFGGQ